MIYVAECWTIGNHFQWLGGGLSMFSKRGFCLWRYILYDCCCCSLFWRGEGGLDSLAWHIKASCIHSESPRWESQSWSRSLHGTFNWLHAHGHHLKAQEAWIRCWNQTHYKCEWFVVVEIPKQIFGFPPSHALFQKLGSWSILVHWYDQIKPTEGAGEWGHKIHPNNQESSVSAPLIFEAVAAWLWQSGLWVWQSVSSMSIASAQWYCGMMGVICQSTWLNAAASGYDGSGQDVLSWLKYSLL